MVFWVGEFGRLDALVLDCWVDVVSFVGRRGCAGEKVRMSYGGSECEDNVMVLGPGSHDGILF